MVYVTLLSPMLFLGASGMGINYRLVREYY